MPKAFCYTEKLEKTLYSDKPVTYYVLEFPLSETFAMGCGAVTTTDKDVLLKTMGDYKTQGFEIIPKVPFFKKIGTTRTFESGFTVAVERQPYKI